MQRRHFLLTALAAIGGALFLRSTPSSPVLNPDGWVPVDVTGAIDLKHFFRDHNLTVMRGKGADGVLASSEFWSAYGLSGLKPGRYTLLREELDRDAYDTEILRAFDDSVFKTSGTHVGHVASLAALQLDGSRGMLPIDKKALFYIEGSASPLCLQMNGRGFEDGFPMWNAAPWPKDRLPWPKGTKVYRVHVA